VDANASQLAGEVRQNWQSPGADAFTGFMQQIDKQLAAIASAAQGCRDMCDDMKLALEANLAQFAAATIAAIIAAVAAAGTVEAAPVFQWDIVCLWAGVVLTLVLGLVAFAQQEFSAGKDIGDAYSDLVDVFTTRAGKIQAASLQLPSLTSARISAPQLWVKQPAP
jgi:hypothetical protein